MQISVHTLGCKLNQAESEELKKELLEKGHQTAVFASGEDIAVIRACAVTIDASRATRELVRKAKRTGARVVVVGCLENRDMPEIDFVAANNNEVLNIINKEGGKLVAKLSNKNCLQQSRPHRTRAFIKIQSGCNFNCAYCVIPAYRGKNQSLPAKEIISKIKIATREGYQEAVLTGVNICQYRESEVDLAKLLKKILRETKIRRVRLGSLDPRLITNEFIRLFSNKRLMPHWHLSLQSGSDKILKKMNRLYTAKQYLEIVKKIRNNNPVFSITTDIIVGFPGETKKDFLQTCQLARRVGFSKIHVFQYSPRPGTKAADMKNQVPDKIKKERSKHLAQIAEETANEYEQRLVGLNREILFENKKTGKWFGYLPEYMRVAYPSPTKLHNKTIKIKIKKEYFV